MRTAACMAFLLIASLTVCGQSLSLLPSRASSPVKQRWQTLLVRSDTLVQGPYSDFVRFAANYEVSKDQTRHFARLVVEERNRTKHANSIIAEKDIQLAAKDTMITDITQEAAQNQENLIDCGQKVASLKPWATVGKIGVIVVSVAVVGIVAAQVVQATTP